jgi:hypothetical protein
MRNNVIVFLGFLFICLVNLHGKKGASPAAKPPEAAQAEAAPPKHKVSATNENCAGIAR